MVQVENPAMLDRRPTEVERIVRLVLGAYGRLEATVFALPPGTMAVRDERGRSIADAFAEAAAIRGSAATVRRAAGG
jgi:hypothetical protein